MSTHTRRPASFDSARKASFTVISNSIAGPGAVVSASVNNVLDLLSVAATAYFSIRKGRSAYAGAAIRVRRSSDDTEQDIGFTAGGDLDTAALTAFVGASSGYVSKWYDQSGNGSDAAQASPTLQPRIVNAGVIDTLGGVPALVGNGSSNQMVINALSSSVSLNAVVRPSTTSGGTGFRGVTASSSAMMLANSINSSTNPWGTYGVSAYSSSVTLATATNYVLTMTGGTFYTAGSPSGTYPSSAGQANRHIFGQSNQWFGGSISEVSWFLAALSNNDRQLLERNQGTYFGIAVA